MKAKTIWSIIALFLIINAILKAEDITIGDVVKVQEANNENIETMAAEVENEVESGGDKKTITYDYILLNNPDGNRKMMVTTKGAFTMQFLVDTKEGSVTYLMSDGSMKKFTLTPEELEKINAQFSLNNLQITRNNLQFAALKNSMKDGTYTPSLETDMIETTDDIIKVDRKRSSKEYVYMEFHDKKAKDIGRQIDEKIAEVEKAPATKKEAKKIKEKFITQMKKKKDKIIRTIIAKRVEKINMKTGQVEETEFFNNNNERIGWTKIKQAQDREYQVRNGKTKKTIQIATETETEMETVDGKSKIRTKINKVKINEPVEFKWMKGDNKN